MSVQRNSVELSAGTGGWSAFWQEVGALSGRWFRRMRRDRMTVAFTMIQPVLWLFLFSQLFQRAGTAFAPEGGSYVAFMTAGVVMMTVFNAAMAGGIEVLFDRELGFLQRLLAAPIHRSALIVSRFIFVLTMTALQGLLIMGMSWLLGVRFATGLPGVLTIVLFSILFGMGIATLSLSLAFVFQGHGAFFALIGFLGLPLMFLSTALAPADVMPAWMRVVVYLNPMSYAIDATRALVLTGWETARLLTMAAALVIFDALALVIGTRVYRRALD